MDAVLRSAKSLIFEELKGDLAVARATADALLADAYTAGDESELAECRLAAGLVATLQGRVADAEAQLRSALERLTGAQAQLAHALAVLARSTAAQFPTGVTAAALEHRPEYRELPMPLNPGDPDPTAGFVLSVLAALPTMRGQIDALALDPSPALAPTLQAYVATIAQACAGVPDALRCYADLAAADLCRRAGMSFAALSRLGEVQARYEAFATPDNVGIGLCQLMRGDWIAAPFTTPLTWNLATIEAPDASSELGWKIEKREQIPAAPDLAEITMRYEDARSRFEAGGAQRGLAAVELRLGYLATLTYDWSAAGARAASARQRLTAAGDERGAQLAAAHAALATVTADPSGTQLEALAIGAWGAEAGCFGDALGIGLLFGRAGRRSESLGRTSAQQLANDAGRPVPLPEADPERADAQYALAQRVFERLGAGQNVVQTIVDRGRLRSRLGDWNTATLLYEEALAHDDTLAEPKLLEDMLRVLRRRFEVLRRQLNAFDAQGNRFVLDRVTARLTALQADARALAGTGSELDGQIDEQLARATVLRVIYLWLLRVRTEIATGLVPAEHATRALALAAEVGDPELTALVYETLGRYEEGAEQYVSSLPAPHLETAESAARATRRLLRLESWAEARNRLEILDRLDPLWRTKGPQWLSYDDLGQIAAMADGDHDEAKRCYEAQLGDLDRMRRNLTLDTLRIAQLQHRNAARPYVHAARWALTEAGIAENEGEHQTAQERREQSFMYAERGQARALLDLIAAARSGGAVARAWRAASARLAMLRALGARKIGQGGPSKEQLAQITEQETLVRDLQDTLAEDPGWLAAVGAKAQLLDVAGVAAWLPEGTLLLKYLFVDRTLLAWAVTEKGVVATLCRSDALVPELIHRVTRFPFICRHGAAVGDWRIEGAAIGEALLKPFAPQLADARELVIVPFGCAHGLPFSALSLDGVPLRDTHTLSVLPSASALSLLGGAQLTAERLFAVAAVAPLRYVAPGMTAVSPTVAQPWTGAVALAAGALWKQHHELLLGSDASAANVREHIEQGQVILLATHGEAYEDLASAALVLANGDLLELHDLLGLDLTGAEIVMLAACETGVGSITGGDEVMALTRGLLGAGAPRAVATLWEASNDSLPLVVQVFLERLHAGARPAHALRAAQQEIAALNPQTAQALRDRLHEAAVNGGHPELVERPLDDPDDGFDQPYHWAPYIHVGVDLPQSDPQPVGGP